MLPLEYMKSQKACIHTIVVFSVVIIIQSYASLFFPQIIYLLNDKFHNFYTVSFSFFAFSILGVCLKMNDNCNEIQKDINQG